MQTVAVIVPVYKNFEGLNTFELISLQQCLNIYKERTIYYIGPKGLDLTGYRNFVTGQGQQFNYKYFPAQYFSGIWWYNRFCLSSTLYRSFLNYKYILIYQTDGFVFFDSLNEWCQKGYDYVGAPWLKGYANPDKPYTFLGVGNGGVSLRNTRSFYTITKNSFIRLIIYLLPRLGRFSFNRWWLNSSYLKKFHHWLYDKQAQEDYFWGLLAKQYFKNFKVPAPEEALEFSFEVMPHYMYQLNGNRLPALCHAWDKYELDFWRPFIKEAGYIL